MEDERVDIKEQIERCRRIAGVLTDEELRASLEQLARDYEAQLGGSRGRCGGQGDGQGFMLRDGAG